MRAAVLLGGTSPEREVSLRSGASVARALREAGIDAFELDVSSVRGFISSWDQLGADVAFVALHGGWGEDGRIQAAMEARGIRFTGSGSAACAAAMDKCVSRERFAAAGVPIPPGVAIRPGMQVDEMLRRAIADWGKIAIKPASGGSTVGVTLTSSIEEALCGVESIWDIDSCALVEKFIEGREMTTAVFGDGDGAFALPTIEIRPRSGFYDYGSKYTKGATEYLCPAPIDAALAQKVADMAVSCHRSLGCRAYSRADFRVTERGEPYALEVNTAPGMTDTSLVPKAAAAHGWTFPEMARRIIEMAMG